MFMLLALDLYWHALPDLLIAAMLGGTLLMLPLALADGLRRTPLRPRRDLR